MPFANPSLALATLAAIALPIAIHLLLRRKRRPIPFGAMQFLLAAYRSQRRRMQMEQLLLLLLRVGVVAFLGLAVGRPLLRGFSGASQGPSTTVLILDTGLTSHTPRTLERQLDAARAELATLRADAGDRAALITTTPTLGPAGQPRPLTLMPPTSDLRSIERALESLRATDAASNLPAAFDAARASLLHEGTSPQTPPARYVLLSDLRAGSLPSSGSGFPVLAPLPTDAAQASTLALPMRDVSEARNLRLDEIQPLRAVALSSPTAPPQPVPVRVEASRSGEASEGRASVHLWALPASGSLSLPDAPQVAAQITFAPGERTANATPTIILPAGARPGDYLIVARLIAPQEANAIDSDDLLASPLAVRSQIIVAMVAPEDAGLDAGLRTKDWLSIALSPEQTPASLLTDAPVRVRPVLSSELTSLASGMPAALQDASLALITSPQTLTPAAWHSLASARAAGLPILVVPPDDPSVSTAWAGTLSDALGVALPFASEPTRLSPDEARTISPIAPALNTRDDPLALLRSELPALAPSVKVWSHLRMQPDAQTTLRPILTLSDGSPLLLLDQSSADKPPLAIWTTPPHLAWTDLPARPLFVALTQELVRQLASKGAGAVAQLAGQPAPATTPPASEYRLMLGARDPASSQPLTIPMQSASPPILPLAGVWEARAASGVPLRLVTVGTERSASDVELPSTDSVRAWLAQPGWRIDTPTALQPGTTARAQPADRDRTLSSDIRLSFYLLCAALVLALIETMYARLVSHAKPLDVSREGATQPSTPQEARA